MPSAIAVALIGGWLLIQTIAGRLPARLLSYRAGELGQVADPAASIGAAPSGLPKINPTNAGFVWPCAGTVTQELGDGHDGMDIANQVGTPIRPSFPGKVVFAQTGDNGGYGNRVIVDHGGAVQTTYNHLSKIDVRVGQSVTLDTRIGLMGNTGNSRGSHLHFEVIVAGKPTNPRTYVTGNP